MKRCLLLSFLWISVLSLPHSLVEDNPDERGPYFQGDILYPVLPMTKNGVLDEERYWPGGRVPFVIEGNFTSDYEVIIWQAIQEYYDQTNGCISFVERTDEENYVIITNADQSSCHSHVGMKGGSQKINYPDWCLDKYGSVLHEMLHTLGFYHQQSTYDRDDYVTIMWENIKEGHENNFNIYDSDTVSQFGYEYDYNSVMHYSKKAFSANGEVTIVTLDPEYQDVIGQREGFSDTDLGKLLAMYNCQ